MSHQLGAGDSYLLPDLLPESLAQTAFENLEQEVKWQTMYHRGKLYILLISIG